MRKTTPILRSFNEAKAREFYVGFLGFEVTFEHRFEPHLPLYLGLKRGDCLLHLSEHHGDACPGSAMRIEVDDVDALCTELNAKGYGFARLSAQTMPWGSRDASVSDPFGNRLTFTSNVGD